jgi:hypothetical protein
MQSEERDKQEQRTKEPGLPTDEPQSRPQVDSVAKTLRCPKCGDSRIRKPSRYFFISLAVFAGLFLFGTVYGLLALPVLSELEGLAESSGSASPVFAFMASVWMVVGVAMLPVSVIWPAVMLATACFAFVGRYRCKGCGHRFVRTRESKKRQVLMPFPVRLVILTGVVLLLIYVFLIVTPNMIQIASGYVPSQDIIGLVLIAFFFGTLFCGCFVYQVLVYQLLKRRLKSRPVWAFLFLLPALPIGTLTVYRSMPSVKAQGVLARGRLAPLPESATDIKVYTWSSLFSGEEFLRFQASPEDVERFLKESPILQGAKCERFSKERMRVVSPHDPQKWGSIMKAGTKCSFPLRVRRLGSGRKLQVRPAGTKSILAGTTFQGR